MLNHVFLIVVHKDPELTKKLVERLASPNHYFLIHVDKKTNQHPFEEKLESVQNLQFVRERIMVNHGRFSQVRCTLQMFNELLESGIKFNYVHLLSGQDYVTPNIGSFDEFFEAREGESFMHYDSEEEYQQWSGYMKKYDLRTERFYIDDFPIRNHHVMLMLKVFNRLLGECQRFFPLRKKIDGLHAGWNWFSWHKTVFDFVVAFLKNNPDFYSRFKYTAGCDELIFHTILFPHLTMMHIHRDNALRFIQWHPQREYNGFLPLILDERDYDEIVNSGAFFCRKVDMHKSGRLLSLIDKSI